MSTLDKQISLFTVSNLPLTLEKPAINKPLVHTDNKIKMYHYQK